MADFLVLFYYWIFLVYDWLGIDLQALFYCCFTAILPLLLLEYWADVGIELNFKYCLFVVLCMVWLMSSFYFTTYTPCTGEIQLYYKAGFVIDLTCGSLDFGFSYLFSRNIKPIKLKSYRKLYHKGDILGNIMCLWCMIMRNYMIRFWYW